MADAIYGSGRAKNAGDATLAQRLRDGPQLLIGSVSLGPGWCEWSQAAIVSKAQLDKAIEIYFFDTVIQNWDRVMPNPNLLMKMTFMV